MPSGFKTTKDWVRMAIKLDPAKFHARALPLIRKATGANALFVVRAVREQIRGGKFQQNAPLTQAMKSGGRPLNMTGRRLFPAITHQMIDEFTVWVGVKMSNKFYNIAKAIHDGAVIPVTVAMRRLFWVLFQASRGAIKPSELVGRAAQLWRMNKSKVWFPIGTSTTTIVIPPRPFIQQAFTPELKFRVQENWKRAIGTALKT